MFDHARFIAIEHQLHRIEGLLTHFTPLFHQRLEIIMSSLESLQQQVAQSNTVMDSSLQLIVGLQSKLQAAIDAAKAGDDHAALDQLAADLGSHSSALAAAVAANTEATTAVNVPAEPSTTPADPGPGVGEGSADVTPSVDTTAGAASSDSVVGSDSTAG